MASSDGVSSYLSFWRKGVPSPQATIDGMPVPATVTKHEPQVPGPVSPAANVRRVGRFFGQDYRIDRMGFETFASEESGDESPQSKKGPVRLGQEARGEASQEPGDGRSGAEGRGGMQNGKCEMQHANCRGKVLNWRAKSTGRLPVKGGAMASVGWTCRSCHSLEPAALFGTRVVNRRKRCLDLTRRANYDKMS